MRKILILFLLCSILSYSKDFKVMTYNIYGGRNASSEMLAESIKKYSPDFIALQEVDKNTNRSSNIDITKNIAEKLGYNNFYFRKSLDYDGGEYGISIISKYEIEKIYVYTLESKNMEKRQIIMAKLKDSDILVVNTHLSYNELENNSQINEFLDVVNSIEAKYKILCGDFNLLPNTEKYKKIIEKYYDTYDKEKPRIDYIFTNTKDFKVTSAEFLENEKDLSDHLPYQVNFSSKFF